MFKGLVGSLGENPDAPSSGEKGGPSDNQMDEIMKQFTNFLQDTDGNNEFKGALDSVVKDIISKDSMYGPMKKLKEAFPPWLESNW